MPPTDTGRIPPHGDNNTEKMTRRLFLYLSCLLPFTNGRAQIHDEGFLNQPYNIRYESQNPTRIAYNPTHDFAMSDVRYETTGGSFRGIDQGKRSHTFGAGISGLRRTGKFYLQGHLRYRNIQDKQQAWNSTLWNHPHNPFLLCDSVPGDASTEAFDLQATASYPLTERLHTALEVAAQTGSRADQTDPRPRTTSLLLPLTAGISYRFRPDWSLGLSGHIALFNSHVEYSNVQPLKNHTYFLMKGMGDYIRRSTGDVSGYPRDYKGSTYKSHLQLVWAPQAGATANFLEMGVASVRQDATDGGTSYTFRGGDYAEQRLTLHNRFQLKGHAKALHNFTLALAWANGKGTWYEQKRETDLEHGNLIYYTVLSKNTIQENQRLEASLRYQFDLLRQGQRDLFVEGCLGLRSLTRSQFLGDDTPRQKARTVLCEAKAGKIIPLGKATLLTQMSGGYAHPLTKAYASGSLHTGVSDISEAYTRRAFAYETAANAHAELSLEVSFPAGKQLRAGLFTHADCTLYTGREAYWNGKQHPSRITVSAGAYLRF